MLTGRRWRCARRMPALPTTSPTHSSLSAACMRRSHGAALPDRGSLSRDKRVSALQELPANRASNNAT